MLNIQKRNVNEIDGNLITRLFSSTYPAQRNSFSKDFFTWRYNKCFGRETKFIGLYDGETFIGQAVIFQQSAKFSNSKIKIAQLADLVVHPDHRSITAVRLIYKALKSELSVKNYDAVFTLPNEKSLKLNKRFLGLNTINPLPARVSIGSPFRSKEICIYETYNGEGISKCALNNVLTPSTSKNAFHSQIQWIEKSLTNRLSDPRHRFGLVGNRNSTMIASPRYIRGIPCVLIMGLFCKSDHLVTKKEWTKLVNASSKLFMNPLHVYFGNNENKEGDFGFSVPSFLKFSKRPVQFLCKNENIELKDFSRLEAIDLDIY